MENLFFYDTLLDRFRKISEENKLLKETVMVTGRALNPEEAIGNPSRKDFPILKGKEKLMQAEFKGCKGQAFTDMAGSFSGTIEEILERKLKNNFDKAVLVSTLNAVCRHLEICDRSIHCKDEDPEQCAEELVEYIAEKYNSPRITLVGLQPSMLERLSEKFEVRALDLDEDNIGEIKFGVKIENGMTETQDALEWCQLIVATGSTVVNGSITEFITDKPVIFFGTTIAGTASLMNLERFCACAK